MSKVIVAWDTETALFRPGVMAPEIACVTWAQGSLHGIIHHTNALEHLTHWLDDDNTTMVGQNVAYDFGVVCAKWPGLVTPVFQKYEKSLITDTMIRQQLQDIDEGCFRGFLRDDGTWCKLDYSLEALCRRHLKKQLDKDTWRLRYGELIDVSLDNWPEGAKTYPIEDAISTLQVYMCQRDQPDEYSQARAAWALHLASAWGVRTDPDKVEAFEVEMLKEHGAVRERCKQYGFVRENGVRNTKVVQAYIQEVCNREGLPVRLTPAGKPSLDADACEATEDPKLIDYARLTQYGSVVAKDLPMLRDGVKFPIHTRYGLVETGRTSSSKPNVQNIRRI